MSTGESHPHGRTACAYEGVNGVNLDIFVDFCFGLFFSLSVHQFSPYPDISFLGFHLVPAISVVLDRHLNSVQSGNPLAFA
jgi:hypothetical protein